MLNHFFTFVLIGLSVVLPTETFACEEVKILGVRRSKTFSDCSFNGGGNNHYFSGDPAVDIGAGKITQKIVSNPTCPYQEHLLIADCGTGKIVVIDGILDPEITKELASSGAYMLGGDYKTEYLFAPYGPVRISQNTQVEKLASNLKADGISTTENLRELIASFKRKNRFDLMCGCKLFYPELMEKPK